MITIWLEKYLTLLIEDRETGKLKIFIFFKLIAMNTIKIIDFGPYICSEYVQELDTFYNFKDDGYLYVVKPWCWWTKKISYTHIIKDISVTPIIKRTKDPHKFTIYNNGLIVLFDTKKETFELISDISKISDMPHSDWRYCVEQNALVISADGFLYIIINDIVIFKDDCHNKSIVLIDNYVYYINYRQLKRYDICSGKTKISYYSPTEITRINKAGTNVCAIQGNLAVIHDIDLNIIKKIRNVHIVRYDYACISNKHGSEIINYKTGKKIKQFSCSAYCFSFIFLYRDLIIVGLRAGVWFVHNIRYDVSRVFEFSIKPYLLIIGVNPDSTIIYIEGNDTIEMLDIHQMYTKINMKELLISKNNAFDNFINNQIFDRHLIGEIMKFLKN